MALFGVPSVVMRPTALVLNIIVSSFVSFRYLRVGLFRWRALWPFLVGALPMAVVGGAVQLPGAVYRPLVGVVLLVSAARLLWPRELASSRDEAHDPPVIAGVLSGIGIGLLSGLTGTGGGIFLSPLVLFMGWCETRRASGVAAVFILCNSLAGLAGNIASVRAVPADLPLFAGAVMIGAVVSTSLGISRLPTPELLKALGLVLVIAGVKLIGVY
jgi:uncharacterized membrane protein YfcA